MHGRIPRLVLAAPLAAVLALALSASQPFAMGGAETPALRSISSRLDGAISTVLIEASEPVAYLTSQPDPLTLLVDLRNVSPASVGGLLSMPKVAPLAAVAVEGAKAPDGAPVARVRLSLDRVVTPRVRTSRNTILVELGASGGSGAAKAPELLRAPVVATAANTPAPVAPKVAPVGKKAAATALKAVRYAKTETGYSITLTGNGPLSASSVSEAKDMPPRVLLDFNDVAIGSAPAVTNIKTDNIERVRVATNSHDPLITRVVIDLARKLPYKVEQIGEDLRVMFERAVESVTNAANAAAVAAGVTANAKPAEPVVVAEEKPVMTREDAAPVAAAPNMTPTALPAAEKSALAATVNATAIPTLAPPPPAAPNAGLAQVAAAIAQASAAAPLAAGSTAPALSQGTVNTTLAQTNQQGQRQFTGDPVTLDFQGADLRAVLRTFAEISNGLNIVIDPSIQGTVDVSLRDVPWDQALDIILRANKLGYSVDGNIVRIVPLTVLAQENEERRKLSEAQALAGDLRTMTVPVSYAKAQDLVTVITRSTLSSRGDVQVDTRTNTLIIRDLADRVNSAAELVRTLDRPQPQVEIEARIVQLNRNSARDLGIQWGFNGKVSPTVGTSTGLAFPSSAGLNLETGGVNRASPSAIGLALGSINGALNLDVTLRALESDGKGRILSTPRVATQNNVEAEITQGSQIPIQTVSNNTVTVQFKDAALTLRVTPQITAANTVIMRIFVEKAAPNYTQTSPAQPVPSIDTQRAVTTVLMDDGETTVIGGIYTREENEVNVKTPYLHRLPLLGWLFKNERRIDDSDELLIFITPRIAK